MPATTVNGVSYTGAEIYATSSARSPFSPNLTDFGPRLGFSWQPATHLVVRGGAGFYYGPSPQMVGGAGLEQRWLLRRHHLERHRLEPGPQHHRLGLRQRRCLRRPRQHHC